MSEFGQRATTLSHEGVFIQSLAEMISISRLVRLKLEKSVEGFSDVWENLDSVPEKCIIFFSQ